MPLKLTRRAGSSFWWITGTINGQRIRESTGTDRRDLAEEARASRETQLYRAAVHGEPTRRATFDEAAASYLSTAPRSPATKARLRRLVLYLGPGLPCDQVDQGRLDQVCDALLRSGSLPATRLREVITPARAILQHAARRGWCAMPAFEPVPVSRPRTAWLRPHEATALVEAAAPHLRPLITVLIATGARLSEALELDWRDVDLGYGRATFRETKNGADRIVELCPRTLAALSALPHRSGAVFRTQRGLPYTVHDRRYGGQVKSAWATALRKAGLSRAITPHVCRHTWATWHYCVHRDLVRLRLDGGWASASQVERYAKLAPEGMAAEILAWTQGRPAGRVAV